MVGKSVDVAGAGSAADHLVQRTLIDGHADLTFESADIFAGDILREGTIERFDRALGILGLRIEWRHQYVCHAKYDLLPRLRRIRLAGAVLWRAENRVYGRRRKRARGFAPFEAGQCINLEMVGGGCIGECRSGFDLFQDLSRLGIESCRCLLLAPAQLDLLFHFVERSLPRRRYANNVIPDVAVLNLQWISLDPAAGGNCRL